MICDSDLFYTYGRRMNMALRQIDARVEELLASMTIEAKAAQMVQVPYAFVCR